MRTLPFIIALFCVAPASAQTGLDRLFLTPAERYDLERLRQQGAGASVQRPETETLEQITLDGYVRNSRGKATAWFNQERSGERHVPAPLQGLHQGQREPVHVPFLRDGHRIHLKVGQIYDLSSNTVRESYHAVPRHAASSR